MGWSWHEWLARLSRAAEDVSLQGEAASLELEVAQTVLADPPLRWALVVSSGKVRLTRQPSEAPDVTVVADESTSIALASGTLTAADALAQGRLKISGRPATLVASIEVLAQLQVALAAALASHSPPTAEREH